MFAIQFFMKNTLIILWICLYGALSWSSPVDDLKEDLKKQPWIENAAFGDQTGMAAFNMILSLGGKYFQLPFLMSERSKLITPARVSSFQRVLDEAYGKIFSTPTGQRICALASLGYPKMLVHQFGVSADFASIWKAHCTPDAAKTLQYRTDTPRSYILLYSEDQTNPAEAWTNSYGVTFISVIPQDLTLDHFIKILTHEMAVRFDKKETVGSWYKLEGLDLSGKDSCDILNIIRNPVLKYAFVSSRAHQVENQVARELGQSIPLSDLSCKEQIQNEIPGIVRLIPLVQQELLIRAAMSQVENCGHTDINWSEGLDTLEEARLCDYFNTPEIGETNLSPTVGGPRPRTTGGWGKSNQKDLLAQSKALDAWLTQPRMQNASSFNIWDSELRKHMDLNKSLEKIKIKPSETKP